MAITGRDERVLVLMPTAKDGVRTRDALTRAGLACAICKDMAELCREVTQGAGAALLTEEAIARDPSGQLQETLRGQPAWSDLPLVVVVQEGGEGRQALVRETMNVTLVERPLRTRSLLSVLRAALRSRHHQYAVRHHLSEHERQAQALRESQDRAHRLLDFHQAVTANMGEGLYAVDAQGLVTYVNAAAEALFGWTSAELLGRKMHEVTHYKHPDGSPFPAEDCAGLRVLREGTTLRDYEDVYIRKDGSFFPVVYSSAPLKSAGRTIGLVVVFRDITERKRADEARARLAAIVESSDDAIVSKTLDGRILSWNAGAQRLFGYSAAEAIGRPITLLIPPERHDEERLILERLGRGEHIEHFETVRVSKAGRRIPISLTISPIRDSSGRVIAASKVARDITARKCAEEALRESQRRFALLADFVPQLIWTADPDGAVDYFNGRWYDFTGQTHDQALKNGWIEVVHPEDVADVRRLWQESLHTGQHIECECRLRAAHGHYEWFLVRGAPLRNDQGQTTKWFGSCTGIDNQKRLEQTLKETDRRKDEFLATLAHELRNPLAPIRNALHLLSLEDSPSPDAQFCHEVIERQVENLVRLVDDLLDVSRITRGKINLQKERVHLEDVVTRAVESSRPLIDAHGHHLDVVLPKEPLWIHADPVRIAQVLWNLLNNAAKYTPDGGRITLQAERSGSDAVISVRDNGMGIAPEMLPRVFDAFTQIEAGRARAEGGLGIGLTLVRRLAEMHGGTVEASSEGLGKGSVFIVRLPLHVGDPASAEPRQDDGSGKDGFVAHHRILVVDDNRDAASSLATLLRFLGNEVRTAHDGPSALGEALKSHPDVVILDIGLPGMNGLDVCRRLRAEGHPGMLLVALSGLGHDDDRRRSQDAGFNAHLVKPVNLDELKELLTLANVAAGHEEQPCHAPGHAS